MAAHSPFTEYKTVTSRSPAKARPLSRRGRVRLSDLAPMEQLIATRMAGKSRTISHQEAEFARHEAKKWSEQLFVDGT